LSLKGDGCKFKIKPIKLIPAHLRAEFELNRTIWHCTIIGGGILFLDGPPLQAGTWWERPACVLLH